MLHKFLSLNRDNLIAGCRVKVARRASPVVADTELNYGMPLFLDQLIKTLKVEQSAFPMESRKVSGPSGGRKQSLSELGDM